MTAQATAARSTPTNASTLPVFANTREAAEKARELGPVIAKRGVEAEAARTVPADTIKDLTDSGLFALVTPKMYGGSGLGLTAMMEVAAEIASVCGSTGWVYGVLLGHNWLMAKFSPRVQEEVFSNPRALTGTVFRLAGTVTAVEGGYRLVNGEGRFCSGIDHCDWVMVGNSIPAPDGGSAPAFFILPRTDVEIVDDWFTAGMRGTGSKSIRIKDAFIPAHRMILTGALVKGDTEGAKLHGGSYLLPFPAGVPFSLVGAPLGMAAGIVNMFAANLSKKLKDANSELIAEQSATLERFAMAAADTESVMAIVRNHALMLDGMTDISALSEIDKARIFRDIAYAAQKCRHAGNNLFEATGGSGIYDTSPLQRMWRDVNAVTAHTAFTWDQASVSFARARLGLPPAKSARR